MGTNGQNRPLSKFNKMYILESLDDNETKTGKLLYEELVKNQTKNKNFQIELRQFETLKEWATIIDEIKVETNNGTIPILHFEIHGSVDEKGMVTNSFELISWDFLLKDLQIINEHTANNLIITLGVCSGMTMIQHIKLNERAPFLVAIGSFHTMYASDIQIRFKEFYMEFFKSLDITEALIMLQKSQTLHPDEYSVINCLALFQKCYEDYLNKEFSQQAIKRRAQQALNTDKNNYEYKLNRSDKKKYYANFKKKLLKYREYFYRRDINNFLMTDLADNKQRFSIPSTTKDFLKKNWNDILPNLIK